MKISTFGAVVGWVSFGLAVLLFVGAAVTAVAIQQYWLLVINVVITAVGLLLNLQGPVPRSLRDVWEVILVLFCWDAILFGGILFALFWPFSKNARVAGRYFWKGD